MTNRQSDDAGEISANRGQRGLSWRAMLAILALAIVAAAAIAYLLVNPFFHQHPR